MKKFDAGLYGYHKKQVNDFVNEFTENYSNLLETVKQRDAQIKNLEDKLEHYEKLEGALNKAIFVAEDASTQIKKLAREESESIVENSKRNANRIINNALLKAEKIEDEAQELKRNVEAYKRKLRSLITDQFGMIEEIDLEELK